MPIHFTAHEGPAIFKIEDALLLYNPAVNPDTRFTEKFRKSDTTHVKLTIHLAINWKRPRTADECDGQGCESTLGKPTAGRLK